LFFFVFGVNTKPPNKNPPPPPPKKKKKSGVLKVDG